MMRQACGFAAAVVVALATLPVSPVARAAAYGIADTDVVGGVELLETRYEDTFASVAEAQGLGWRELIDANPGVDPWLPGEGTVIDLPTGYVLPSGAREGVVINVAEFRLYYFPPGGRTVVTYPVGLGRLDYPTPLVDTRVTSVVPNPAWAPGPTARREHAARGDPLPAVVPPGPDNPMGSMAIALGIPSYFIHGTNQPFAVGQTASLGCVRMFNPHVEALAEMVRSDMPVRIVSEPYKVGWRHGELYAEVHPDVYGTAAPDDLQRKIEAAVGDELGAVNWALVQFLLDQPTGIPTPILHRREEPVAGFSIAQTETPNRRLDLRPR